MRLAWNHVRGSGRLALLSLAGAGCAASDAAGPAAVAALAPSLALACALWRRSSRLRAALEEPAKRIVAEARRTPASLARLDATRARLDDHFEMLTETSRQREPVLRAARSDTERLLEAASRGIERGQAFTRQLIDRAGQASRLVRQLERKVGSIHRVAETVSRVADKTHLLSINASIEAARAGEAGRGFSVVAEEIRLLAENASRSVEGIEAVRAELEEVSAEAAHVVAELEEDIPTGCDGAIWVFEDGQEARGEVPARGGTDRTQPPAPAWAELNRLVGVLASLEADAVDQCKRIEGSATLLADQGDAIHGLKTTLDDLAEASGRLRTLVGFGEVEP